MFRETVSGVGRLVHRQRHRARHVPGRRRAAGLQEVRPQAICVLEVGKTATHRGARWRSARVERDGDRDDRIAARRRDVEGNRRQHHERDARPAAERQRQLHRLRRPAARHRPVDQHRVVRQRLDQRQRPGSAQQQLHRVDGGNNNDDVIGQRAGHAGADADRSDPGVPGHHQPVRRRVRPDVRRGGQRGDQVGHQQPARQRASASSRTAA